MAQQSSFKGNPIQDYVTVAERIEKFYERYRDGRIVTHIVEHDIERGFILMRAEGYRNSDDAMPSATGHAFELRSEGYVNRTSYIENCESSSVGRMLAIMGFEVRRGISSREEMEKVARMTKQETVSMATKELNKILPRASEKTPESANQEAPLATETQKETILDLLESSQPGDRKAQHKLLVNFTGKQSRDELTEKEARDLIEALKQKARTEASSPVQDDPLI
jgi:hypothetical protein